MRDWPGGRQLRRGDARKGLSFLGNVALEADTDQLRESARSGHVRRPPPAPDVRRGRLRAAGRLGSLGELHGSESRQDLPPEQLRTVDGTRVGLVPLRQRPLAGRNGRATPTPGLGRLSGVGGDAGIAADLLFTQADRVCLRVLEAWPDMSPRCGPPSS